MITRTMYQLAKLNGVLDKVRGDEVNLLIREKYSQSEENALNRKMIRNPNDEKVKQEFEEFSNFVDECIKKVDAELAKFEG